MKKALSLLLCTLLVLTTIPMGALSFVTAETVQPTIVVDNVIGEPGETIAVTVNLKDNPGIVSAKVAVGYDADALELLDYEAGAFSAEGYSWSVMTRNPFIINWCDAIHPDSTEELLATLTFRIKDTAAIGSYPLTLTFSCDDDVYNYDLDTVWFDGIDGSVTVIPHEHVYDNACDPDCNGCGAIREVPDHVYDHACDVDCNECGAIRTITHNYTAAVTAPTCVNGGYTTYTCSVCDHSYVADYTNALGHTEVIDDAVAPTCTETGLTEGKHCDVCGEVLIAQQTVAALGHNYTAAVTAPDCVNGGYTTYPCSVCGHSYVADHTDALGHTEVIDAAVAPTCTETGLTEGKHCDVCGEVLVAQQTVAALGHNYTAAVTAPTCAEQGYTTHTCSACGDAYTDNYIPATGKHTYDDETDTHCNVCDFLRGDTNDDNRVNNRDLGILQRFLNEWDIAINTASADISGDGRVNNRDLGLLQHILNA